MALKTCKRGLKKADQHGYHIGFTYKNSHSYQTPLGGVVSILSRLGVVAFFFVLVNNIVNKEKTVTFKSVTKPVNSNTQNNYFDLSNFDLAFGLSFLDGLPHLYEKQNIQKYFAISFQYFNIDYVEVNGTQVMKRIFKSIGYSPCNLTRFNNNSKEMVEMGMDQVGWYCINELAFPLVGQMWSNKRSFMKFNVNPCVNSTTSNTTCASTEEINSILARSVIFMGVLQSYFDQDDFGDQPYKNSIMVIPLNGKPELSYSALFPIKRTLLTTKDYWLSNYLQNKEYEFFQLESAQVGVGTIRPYSNEMISIFFANFDQELFIERKVLTLVDVLATCGGFANIIIFITRVVARMYSRPLFYTKLLSKLYKEQPKGSLTKLEFLDETLARSDEIFKKIKEAKPLRVNLLRVYWKHVFDILRCKNLKNNHDQESLLFERLNKRLDIFHLMKSLKNLKSISKLVLKKYQYEMIPYINERLKPLQDIHTIKRKQSLSQSYKEHRKSDQERNLQYSVAKCLSSKSKIGQKILKQLMADYGISLGQDDHREHSQRTKEKSKSTTMKHMKQSHLKNTMNDSQRKLFDDVEVIKPRMKQGKSKDSARSKMDSSRTNNKRSLKVEDYFDN